MKKMKNCGFMLLILFSCSLTANAQKCSDPSKMLGTWEVYQGDGLFAGKKEAVSAAQLLESGKKSLQDVTKGAKAAPGETNVMNDGTMKIMAVMEQTEPPMTIRMTMTALWRLDCDIMTVQMESVDRIKVALDDSKITEQQREEIRKTTTMMSQAAMDPEFRKPQRSKILFAGKTYVLTEDMSSQPPSLSLLKKK